MPVSTDIFELIIRMTRKERSFFRRYYRLNSQDKGGAVIRLFEKLVSYSAQNEFYDEEKLKGLLDENTLKHLPVTKNNLYGLLLRSLNEYTGRQTNEDKIRSLIEQHDILFSKSLLKQSENVLKKARILAEENEMFMHIHTILNKERILARYTLNAEGYERVVKRAYSEQMLNIERIKNLSEMNDLGSRFTTMLQKYPTSRTRSETEMKEVREVMESPLLEDETKMLSNLTLKRFYNLKSVAADWMKDPERFLRYAKKYAEITEENAGNKTGNLHEYIISLGTVLTACIRAVDLEEYEKAIIKLTNADARFKFVTERDRMEIFYCLGLSVFSASADNYHPERGEAMLIEAEEKYKQLEKVLSPQQQIIWYFVIGRFCFAQKAYPEAGKWLNRLIGLGGSDLSQDYQCYGRIMNLIVAYESGNPDTIEHALRMAYYFLTKRNKVYRYEKIILDYVRRSFRVRSQSEINEMLVFMHRDLSAIFNDPFEENAFDAFNILTWLEWKIN